MIFHAFPKSIKPKLNFITLLEFELAYYDVAVLHVSHYTTRFPLPFVFGCVELSRMSAHVCI